MRRGAGGGGVVDGGRLEADLRASPPLFLFSYWTPLQGYAGAGRGSGDGARRGPPLLVSGASKARSVAGRASESGRAGPPHILVGTKKKPRAGRCWLKAEL